LLLATALVGGCTGGGGDAETVVAPPESTPTTETTSSTGTTTGEATPVEPALTHAAFIRQLDRLCRKGNRLVDRRYGGRVDAAIEANDYEGLADLLERVGRVDRRFDRADQRLLDQASPEDAKALSKYIALSEELDNYRKRYVRALRRHDDDELDRLNVVDDKARNKRTRVTAQMGLTECGM
jgi:hypothetical protein